VVCQVKQSRVSLDIEEDEDEEEGEEGAEGAAEGTAGSGEVKPEGTPPEEA
jgi:hypothetical protein